MTTTEEPQVYEPTAQDLADGLRKLAEFVETHPDGPGLTVMLSVGWDGNGPIHLTQVLEAGDDFRTEPGYGGVGINAYTKFGLLPVRLLVPDGLLGEKVETVKTVTEVVPFTREELIARGWASVQQRAEEPF